MRTTWIFAFYAATLACGSADGPGTEVPGSTGSTDEPGASSPAEARRQLALVPETAAFVAQADVGRLFRRSATRDGEALLQRLVRTEEPGADTSCAFDLAERVRWATFFFQEQPGVPDAYVLLLETDVEPAEIAACLEAATNREVHRIPSPPGLSDAVVVGERDRVDDDSLAILTRDDGLLVIGEPTAARALLADDPERSIADSPLYRSLVERLGFGEASFVFLEGGGRPEPEDDRPPEWGRRSDGLFGLAGVLRASARPPEVRVVLTHPDPEEVGDAIEGFQEVRGEARRAVEEARATFEGLANAMPDEIDADRTARTLDLLLTLMRGTRVIVEEQAATFEVFLPEGADVPTVLADLAYAALVWIAASEL
ncbi:MAG: hypothetical protein JXB32_00400 [Deltaproteobacteria bacterium]|nr:hypothetical protein [Deltaproteobacteria bacterium]